MDLLGKEILALEQPRLGLRIADDLLKTSGLKVENPYEKWVKSMEILNQLREDGALFDREAFIMAGKRQTSYWPQQDHRRHPPEALVRGTVAAYSEVAKLQRGAPGETDPMKAIAELQKQQLAEDKKANAIGKQILDAARENKFKMIGK